MSGNPTFHSCLEKVTRIWGPPELWGFHDGLIEPWKCVWTFVKTDSCEGTNSIRRTFSSSIILKKIFSKGFVGEAQIGGEHIFQESLNCKEKFYFSKYNAFVGLTQNAINKNVIWEVLQKHCMGFTAKLSKAGDTQSPINANSFLDMYHPGGIAK